MTISIPLIAFLFALIWNVAARAADTYAYVAQTSNASSLSYLNSTNGSQVGGVGLGVNTNTGAVYSANGRIAFVLETVENPYSQAIVGFNRVTGKRLGSFPPATMYSKPSR